MSLKEKLAAWYLAKRIRKATGLSREEVRQIMKPFPKIFGIISALVAAAPAVVEAYKSGGWMPACMTILGVLGVLNSHSMTGTGGKPVE